MRRTAPLLLPLILLFAACSAIEPPATTLEPDAPLTSITLTTNLQKRLAPLGIPFEDGNPVVTTLEVQIFADEDRLSFDANADTHTYNPDGDTTTLAFPSAGSITVALPAGSTYTFKVRGNDIHDGWIAYGETSETVTVSTTSVNLTLRTLLDRASIDTRPSLTSVPPGETLDFYLKVLAPGEHDYAVPFEDYTVTYTIDEGEAVIHYGASNAGVRVTTNKEQSGSSFMLTASVTGWIINDDGNLTHGTISAQITRTFSAYAGLTLDSTAPEINLNDPGTLPVGAPAILTGSASDSAGLDRVQVYEGPVLIGSSDTNEHSAAGVAQITFTGHDWEMQWIAPSTAGVYTIRAVAIDAAGNQSEYSLSVTALRPIDVHFFNGTSLYLVEPAGVGAILRLTGYSEGINHNDFTIELSRLPGEEPVLIAHGDEDEAASKGVATVIFEEVHHMREDEIMFSEKIWSVLWRPDAPGKYSALAADGAGYHDATVAITVE